MEQYDYDDEYDRDLADPNNPYMTSLTEEDPYDDYYDDQMVLHAQEEDENPYYEDQQMVLHAQENYSEDTGDEVVNSLIQDIERLGDQRVLILNMSSYILNAFSGEDRVRDWDRLEGSIKDLFDALQIHKKYYSESQVAMYLSIGVIFSYLNKETTDTKARDQLKEYIAIIVKNRKRTRRLFSDLLTVKKSMSGLFAGYMLKRQIYGYLNNITRLLKLIKHSTTDRVSGSSGFNDLMSNIVTTSIATSSIHSGYRKLVENIVVNARLTDASSYYKLIATVLVRENRYLGMVDTPSQILNQETGWYDTFSNVLSKGVGLLHTDETLGIAKTVNGNLDELFDSVDNFGTYMMTMIVVMIVTLAFAYLMYYQKDKKQLKAYRGHYDFERNDRRRLRFSRKKKRTKTSKTSKRKKRTKTSKRKSKKKRTGRKSKK